jgi:hypothetical protein
LPNWAKFRGKRKETLKSYEYLLPRVFHYSIPNAKYLVLLKLLMSINPARNEGS